MLCLTALASWRYLTRRLGQESDIKPVGRMTDPARLPWRNGRAWLAPSSQEMNLSMLPSGVILGLFTALVAVGSFAIGAVSGTSSDRCGWLLMLCMIALLAPSKPVHDLDEFAAPEPI